GSARLRHGASPARLRHGPSAHSWRTFMTDQLIRPIPGSGRPGWQTGAMAALTIPWLPFPLAPAGQPPVTYKVNADSLALTAAAGTDLFVDPAGAAEVPDAGRLVGNPPPGDFSRRPGSAWSSRASTTLA